MSLQHPTVAIVGATGAVGAELIGCLERRNFPLERLRLFASRPASPGRKLLFRGQGIVVEELMRTRFPGIDIALFSAGSGVSRRFGPIAVRQGAVVVDNSSAFRMEPGVPLVVPEVNARGDRPPHGSHRQPELRGDRGGDDAGPLIGMPIRRVIAATYQAASGAGRGGDGGIPRVNRGRISAGTEYERRVLAHPYAFHLFSHDTKVDPASGYNEEETKVMRELRKIMSEPEMRIGITCQGHRQGAVQGTR